MNMIKDIIEELYGNMFDATNTSTIYDWRSAFEYQKVIGYDEMRYLDIRRSEFSQMPLGYMWNNHDKIFRSVE